MLSSQLVASACIGLDIGNVQQNPGDAFTLAGSVITFANPPPATYSVVVFHKFNSTDAN